MKGYAERLIRLLYEQSFKLNVLSPFINPLFLLRAGLVRGIRRQAVQLSGLMLDFGCGIKPYRELLHVRRRIGVEVAADTGHDRRFLRPDVFYDGGTLPFKDEAFDSVFSSEVLEHVSDLEAALAELRRVVKQGGVMLVTVPFCVSEHETPYDFRRLTSFGIKQVLTKSGFEVVGFEKSGHFVAVIFQLAILYLFDKVRRFGLVGYAVMAPLSMILSFGGLLLGWVLPKSEALYFSNIVLARKKGR